MQRVLGHLAQELSRTLDWKAPQQESVKEVEVAKSSSREDASSGRRSILKELNTTVLHANELHVVRVQPILGSDDPGDLASCGKILQIGQY